MEKYIAITITGVMGVVGAVLIIIAIVFELNHKKKIVNCTVQTTGTVIKIERYSSSDGFSTPTVSWFPVYEYYADGYRIEKRSSFGFAKQIFYEGQKVEILYNPLNYNEYYVPEASTGNVSLILGTIGSVFILCALGACFLYFNFVK